MDEVVDFKLKKNEESRLILFITFKKASFDMADEKISKDIIAKYARILKKYTNLYIITDTRGIDFVTPELAWKLINDLIKCNEDAVKNVRKSCVLISSKGLLLLVNRLVKVYNFVVPTKICETNEDALKFIEG
jgi:hypothetical protein